MATIELEPWEQWEKKRNFKIKAQTRNTKPGNITPVPFHRKAFLQHIHFYFKAQSSEAFESLVLSDRYVNQNLEETDYVVCYVYR